jgi:hypothetical protein
MALNCYILLDASTALVALLAISQAGCRCSCFRFFTCASWLCHTAACLFSDCCMMVVSHFVGLQDAGQGEAPATPYAFKASLCSL